MTFVQNQEITMPENVRYITELIANYCYKGLKHDVWGSTGENFSMFCSLLYMSVYMSVFS